MQTIGSRVFNRSRKCLRLAILFGLLAVIAAAASNPGVAQTASFRYGIAVLGGGFNSPQSVAVDSSGNVYVADALGVKEMPAGCVSSNCVTVLGGTGLLGPTAVQVDRNGNVYDGSPGGVSEMPPGCVSPSCVTVLGEGLPDPTGLAVDGSGNVYVADSPNFSYAGAVKKMTPNCTSLSCVTALDGGFTSPSGVAVDGSGNIYVVGAAVQEMPAGCTSPSCVTTLGGGWGSLDSGVAVDGSGNIYVTDYGDNTVKEMPAGCASSSCVTVLAGGFTFPYGVAVDGSGNVYVADYGNGADGAVKEIMTGGVNFNTVPVGATSTAIPITFTFNSAGSLNSTTPYQVLTQGAKNLDFNAAATQGSNACNGTTAYTAGNTCTVNVTFTPTVPGTRYGAVELLNAGGSAIATAYLQGTGVGPQVNFLPGTQSVIANASNNGLSSPWNVAVDAIGNVYIADGNYNLHTGTNSSQVLKETLSGGSYTQSVVANAANNGLNSPGAVAVDGSGNVYIADSDNNRVLKEMPSASGYTQSVVADQADNGVGDPTGVAVDGSGNVYIADYNNCRVLKETLSAGGYTQSVVASWENCTTYPYGMAVDGGGNVYFVDYWNDQVLKEALSAGGYTQSVVESDATTRISGQTGVAVDGSGNVYIADYPNGRVLKETLSAGSYTQSVIANDADNGIGDPGGVAVDGSGNVYVTGPGFLRVWKEDFADPPSLTFATTAYGATSADSPQTVTLENVGNAPLSFPIPATGNNPSTSANFTLNSGASACQVEGSGTSTEATLAPGAYCDLYISFTPEAVGTLSGSVVLTDNNLNAAAPGFASQSIALNGTAIQATQTINFPNLGTQTVGVPLTLSATASSGLAVSFTSTTTSICTVSGDHATFIASGTCTIAANQAGNADYAPATQVTQSIVVNPSLAATLTSPTPGLGTTLGTTNVAFQWTTVGAATDYQLNLSAVAPGQSELFLYKGTATTATAPSIPGKSAEVYATRYTKISGVWQSNSYVYYESGPRLAALTSPTPGLGTILGPTGVTFKWTTGAEVADYQLNLSAIGQGQSELFVYKGTATSAVVPTLPANGATVYATLYSKINGAWQSIAYQYTESGTPTPATLTSPTPGLTTILGTASVLFQWTAGGGATEFQLNLSATTPGASDLFLYKGTSSSATVPTLPAHGVTVYATLYSKIKGTWQSNSYVYTESGSPTLAALTSPAPGLATILGTSNVLFQWSAGTSASLYQLNLSKVAPGNSELFLYKGTALSATDPALPANGVKVYARLYSKIDGVWLFNDYVYTEQ